MYVVIWVIIILLKYVVNGYKEASRTNGINEPKNQFCINNNLDTGSSCVFNEQCKN